MPSYDMILDEDDFRRQQALNDVDGAMAQYDTHPEVPMPPPATPIPAPEQASAPLPPPGLARVPAGQIQPLSPARKELASATAQPTPAPPPASAPQGRKPMPWWAMALRALPGVVTNGIAAAQPGSRAVLEGVNRRSAQNDAMYSDMFQDRSNLQDAEAAQYRQDLANAAAQKRQQAGDAESKRRFDLVQGTREQDLKAKRDNFQATAATNAVRAQKQDSMDALKAKDLNSRITVRESREARRLKGGSGSGTAPGGPKGMSKEDAYAALDKTYGGPDKVPAAAKAQVDLALSLPPKDRAKALAQVMGQSTAGARTGAGSQNRYDLQEMKAYMAQSEPSRRSLNSVNEVKASLEGMGIKVDEYKEGQRVPGQGRLEQHMFNLFEDEKGQEVRRVVRNMAADLVKEKSGLVTTDAERQLLMSIVGAGDSMSAKQLLLGVQLMERISQRNLDSAAHAYPHAHKAYNSPDDGDTPDADPAAMSDDDLMNGLEQ